MTRWKNTKGQVLATTNQDGQGEVHTRESLNVLRDKMAKSGRLPLNQQHDLSLDTVGYIENFEVKPNESDPNEYALTGDIYFHDVDLDEALQGFSYSITEKLVGPEQAEVAVYLPHPFYNDLSLLEDFANIGVWVSSGAWRKKSLDPATVSLVISLVLFATAPLYTNFWNKKVAPVLEGLRERLGDDHSVDFAQMHCGPSGKTYAAYFIPPRGSSCGYLTVDKVFDGNERLDAMIQEDELAISRGVHLARLTFSEDTGRFEITSIQYSDGSVINHNNQE
jgi:hypothetical protein